MSPRKKVVDLPARPWGEAGEWQLFEPGTRPECTTVEWYAGRDRAPHLEQPGHRERLLLAAQFVRDAAARTHATSVSDLGAGDGGLLQLLAGSHFDAWGYDLQPSNIAGATERGVDVELADVLDLDGIVLGNIVVATEMLEHLTDPHGYLRALLGDGGPLVVVASSPFTETGSSHYEHHLWAWDKVGYRRLFEEAGWRVWAHETVSMFQVLMAYRPTMRP